MEIKSIIATNYGTSSQTDKISSAVSALDEGLNTRSVKSQSRYTKQRNLSLPNNDLYTGNNSVMTRSKALIIKPELARNMLR
jgi:hypothetical protein